MVTPLGLVASSSSAAVELRSPESRFSRDTPPTPPCGTSKECTPRPCTILQLKQATTGPLTPSERSSSCCSHESEHRALLLSRLPVTKARARSVWNPGPSSRLHFTKPDDSSRTLCGWLWPTCLKSVPDPPPDCAPVCAKCRTTFTAAPFTTIDAGASQSTTSSSSSSTS